MIEINILPIDLILRFKQNFNAKEGKGLFKRRPFKLMYACKSTDEYTHTAICIVKSISSLS